MIVIDGYKWPVPCDVDRTAQVTPSEISGMMLDKTYFNDVLGTYMRYDISLAVPPSLESSYSTLYETLTDPIDGHSFVIPYGQSTLEVVGRVNEVKDTLVYTVSHKQYWRGIKFTITANHPTKYDELGEVVARGRTPMPEQVELPVGTVYQLTEDGWYQVSDYENLDVVHF